jgi:hypothetical protein
VNDSPPSKLLIVDILKLVITCGIVRDLVNYRFISCVRSLLKYMLEDTLRPASMQVALIYSFFNPSILAYALK